MGETATLRIVGGVVAAVITVFATRRYRKGQLRRGELLGVFALVTGLVVAAVAPDLLNGPLGALGFEEGGERRIIGLLVVSQLVTLALLVVAFSRDDQTSGEIGRLVDHLALRRIDERDLADIPGSCTVVVPAFDEADNLPSVLGRMPDEVGGLPVVPLVVADGCTDATEEVASKLGAVVVRRDLRRGSGAAVRLGCRIALRRGAEIVVTLDADGQHDPTEMPALVEPLLEGAADVVQGSRVLGSFEVTSPVRKHGVTWFARLLTLAGRTKITDPSTGYRAMSADALRKLDLRQDQFYVSEIILEAARKGLRVAEVPITVRARASGVTKKPPTARYAWGFSKAIIRTWLR